jgi:hypothetical protein
MKNQPGFPAGVNIGGTEYFYEDELVAYEETHRRQRSETRTPAGSHEPEAPSPALLRKDAPPKAVT